MTNLTAKSVDLSRFGAWLIKNKLAEHESMVVKLLESDFVHAKGDNPDAIKDRPAGSVRRSFNKVISRAKLREVLVSDYIRDDFQLYQMTRETLKDILVRSVKSKYKGDVVLEKSAHRQGIYVSEFKMPRKSVKAAQAVEQSVVV